MRVQTDGIIFDIQSYGGISVYFENLIKHLSSFGCDVRLVGVRSQLRIGGEVTVGDSGFVERCMPNSARQMHRLPVAQDVDVFHSSYYRVPRRGKSVKVVTTVHDFAHERGLVSGVRSNFLVAIKKRAIAESDVIICISEFTKNELIDIYPEFAQKDIRVIYNGVSEEFYEETKGSSSEKTSSNDGPTFLYIGSRASYKQFDVAIQLAASADAGALLHIVGGGELTVRERELLDYWLKGRYEHFAFLENIDLVKKYKKSAALFYPSKYEGFGIPCVEAMAVGCPVVCWDTQISREICGDAAFYLNGNSEDKFAEVIDALFDVVVVRDKVEIGKNKSRSLTWRNSAAKTFDVYKDMVLAH